MRNEQLDSAKSFKRTERLLTPESQLAQGQVQGQVVAKSLSHRTTPKSNGSTITNGMEKTVYLLDRNIHKSFPVIVGGKGNYQ